MTVLVVLGSPNSPEGELFLMAKKRLDRCYQEYLSYKYSIILTGGFGVHFNTSNQPHHYWTKQYLIQQGVDSQDIIAVLDSTNTVQDAVLLLPILAQSPIKHLVIITSDYHQERVEFIFKSVLGEKVSLSYIGVHSEGIDPEILDKLITHETLALEGLRKNGVYL
ncbi:MAG: YdcF family protein [Arcicella sp.]|nr:YdcF family protein [Arcicella sp.]